VDGDVAALRVVTSNALRSNRRADAWAAAVLALEPDVLCVQEVTAVVDGALARAGVAEALPGGCAEVRKLSAGTGVWTRLPVEATELTVAGYVLAAVRLAVGAGVTVASIHTVAPAKPRQGRRWRGSFDAIAGYVARTPGPLVVAGDWNATLAHTPLRTLLDGGRLRDAHLDAGRAHAATWPARWPRALLDRVLVSDEIAVRAVSEHRVPGSDHRAVAADLVVVG
jgi:endonuclease/exonuclease/phosphatase family metal-dependent hydrolase